MLMITIVEWKQYINLLFFLGTYIPLTTEGKIIVNGILASCYPAVDHDMIHIGMTPIQLFPEMIEWIFGDDKGFQAFVSILGHLGRPILPDGILHEIYNQFVYFQGWDLIQKRQLNIKSVTLFF